MNFFAQAVGVLQTLVNALGGGVGVLGLVNFMEGYGNDNPASKAQGIKQMIAGGGIATIGAILVPQLATLF